MSTIPINDEITALRSENARLRAENAQLRATESLGLLYRIRQAAGLNRYVGLSDLDSHVRRMRAVLQEMVDTMTPLTGADAAVIECARQIARGTGDVPEGR